MFLLNEYSRNILLHVRPQTVASQLLGQTKLFSMNESLMPPLIRMNAVLNSCFKLFTGRTDLWKDSSFSERFGHRFYLVLNTLNAIVQFFVLFSETNIFVILNV